MSLDSSFMAPPIPAPRDNPFAGFMDTLRSQIISEVRTELTADVVNRVVEVVGRAIGNVTIQMPAPNIIVTVAAPEGDNGVAGLQQEIASLRSMLQDAVLLLSSPVQRSVMRDENDRIVSVIDRRM